MGLRNRLIVLAMCLLFSESAFAAFFGPSDEELEADIDTVQGEISQTEAEIDKYTGGLIKSLVMLRKEILLNTAAMLKQKQYSIINFVDLEFTIDGKPFESATPEQLALMETDIKNLNDEIAAQKEEASEYSGGLILVMKLSALETTRLTLTTLRMRYLTAKHGVPIFGISTSGKASEEEDSPGHVVKDEDAL